MTKTLSFIAAGLVVALSIAGCNKNEYFSFEELDDANIREYIQKNNLTVHQYKETDLFYQVLEEGTGRPIDYKTAYPVVYTEKSLDGEYNSGDTMSFSNRYVQFFGYFPFGSAYAGSPTVERTGDFKEVIRDILKNTHGKIRILVPSRLMYGRRGVPNRGIPPNASLDFVVTVHDNFEEFENDWVIPNMVKRAGLTLDELTRTDDGIYYKILTQGTGDPISVDSTITTDYTLKRPDGSTIESNTGYTTKVANVIPAWVKIIPLLNKGGKVRIFLPSTEAYGTNGSTDGFGRQVIPPYASLDFEITIKEE